MQGSSSSGATKEHARPRILVAGPWATFKLIASVLRIDAEFFFANTIEQGLRHVESGMCLIVCSERFDESRMFNFLHALEAIPDARSVPLICCRQAASALSPTAHRVIAVALEALGVHDFLDMPNLRAAYGAEVAEEVLRSLLLERLRARYKAVHQPEQAPGLGRGDTPA
jgi:hypothetical protein